MGIDSANTTKKSKIARRFSTLSFLFEPDEEDDYVTIRRSNFRRARILVAIGSITVLGLFLLWFAFSWFGKQIDPPGEPGESVQIVVPTDSGPGDVASILYDNEVVPNGTFFRLWLTYRSYNDFQGGTYTLKKNMSADEAISVLSEGPEIVEEISFVIGENKWVSEILIDISSQLEGATETEIAEEDLLSVLDSGKLQVAYRPDEVQSWEGLLLPGTYTISTDATAEEILTEVTGAFNQASSDAGFGAVQQKLGNDPYEVLIMASLIEAEVNIPESRKNEAKDNSAVQAEIDQDRKNVSQVIRERLRKNMALDIDATSIYSSGNRELSGADLIAKLSDPEDLYNTSSRGGKNSIDRLPPTPIGSVSEASMRAAANPSSGTFLYYTVIDSATGKLKFSATEEENEKARDEARANGVELRN